ncbi:TPA: glycosyltransferase family 2 protein [Vibrio parahaemolyticus]|uniref:glycosyltransferase family 2 protein n=1 Tax=Vibrio TaxID=662 RepID=UPI00111E63E5|nr:glycosyltransferase family A protein [Vibrio parahaemolyticus]EHR5462504.1 glycosyltransferase family 2 protein [Vibrio parahaemolyticus]EIO2934332.1 glycosyltransferase family 2 protein [Vibrio parahaemolyticus]EJE4224981.1 glycosyltransferase family 2 protein [Vibrio parahaemolyticus]MDF5525326.1 glycosyltransferase family A protein [Vibrio parahaemolyticus]MDF5552153.1 glycosyltransferase family A protein [Vibrio parahaemolyticus]
MSKLISIIIPHYKCESGLKKLLDSIFQTLEVDELNELDVIVIDDNSMTQETFSHFSRKYGNVSFLRNHSVISGAGSARNVGLEKAVGEYVLFADSDDFFKNDWLRVVKLEIRKKTDIVYFPPMSEKDNGEASDRHKRYCKLVENFTCYGDDSIRYRFHVPWSKLISRSLISKNKIYFDEVIASNDVMFSLKVGTTAKSISCSDYTIYSVVEREGSLTSSQDLEKEISRLYVLVRYNSMLKSLRHNEFSISLILPLVKILKMSPVKFFECIFTLKEMKVDLIHPHYFFRFLIKR